MGTSCLVTLLAKMRIVPEDGLVWSKGILKNSSVTLSLPDVNQNVGRANREIIRKRYSTTV